LKLASYQKPNPKYPFYQDNLALALHKTDAHPSAYCLRSAFDRDLRLKGAGTLEIDLDRCVEEELKRLILSLTPWVLTSGATRLH